MGPIKYSDTYMRFNRFSQLEDYFGSNSMSLVALDIKQSVFLYGVRLYSTKDYQYKCTIKQTSSGKFDVMVTSNDEILFRHVFGIIEIEIQEIDSSNIIIENIKFY